MDKLIDLLNEYEEEKTDLTFKPHFWDAYGGHLSFLEYNDKYSELLCISKRYEFIQRLVKNDKIDRDKFKEKNGTHGMRKLNKRFNVIGEGMIDGEDYSDLESILMILSIQENPISFLISILM